MRKTKCKHTHAKYDTLWRGERVTVMGCYAIVRDELNFGYGEGRQIFSARCIACGELLPLAPAYEPEDVRVEMRAAELSRDAKEAWSGVCPGIALTAERWGWDDYEACALDSPEDAVDSPEWHAGYLAHEIAEPHADISDIAWPWNPTRPIAGQYEEYVAAQSCPVDHGHAKSVAALTVGIIEAGGTLPYPGAVAEASADPTAPEPDDYDDLMCHLNALDDIELSRVEDDIRHMEATDPPLTVSIDSDGSPAAQINHLCDAPPMFTPDEAEALAGDLLLGADAARQAAHDGYHGPAVVVELLLGEEPEYGVEFDVEEAHEAGADCPMMGCLEDGAAYDPDEPSRDEQIKRQLADGIFRMMAPAIAHRQAAEAAEDALRDPETRAACQHERLTRGSNVPRRYGSFASEVCRDCGAFRTMTHHGEDKSEWQPASEYAEATAEQELD